MPANKSMIIRRLDKKAVRTCSFSVHLLTVFEHDDQGNYELFVLVMQASRVTYFFSGKEARDRRIGKAVIRGKKWIVKIEPGVKIYD